jgi:DNA-directed RNA polymerase specialized sigma24 family protein
MESSPPTYGMLAADPLEKIENPLHFIKFSPIMSHLQRVSSGFLQQIIVSARAGDETALNQIAEYLLPKAFEIARSRMQALSPMDDYEDIAISAVKSICLRFREGTCEFLGEIELGSLLQKFVIGKVRDRRKYHFAEKRDIKLNDDRELSRSGPSLQNDAVESADSIWLDEQSALLTVPEQAYLEQMLTGLGADVHGLFSELVKRLDEKPRQVLMLITSVSMSNAELSEALDCAPSSIERYRRAIREKLEEIVKG